MARAEAKPINIAARQVMGFAELVIGRAFARPVGSTHPANEGMHPLKIVDLSRELYHRTPTYPGHPPIMHGVWKTHEESFVDSGSVWGLASMFISMPDHGGTHID